MKTKKAKATTKAKLLIVTTTYTYEEFLRFCKTISKKRIRKCDIIIVVSYLVIAALAFLQKQYNMIPVYLLFIPTIMIFARLFLHFAYKRIWKSNKDAENLETQFRFHADNFVQSNKLNRRTIKYSELTRIIETDTNFYLMTAEAKGSIINKKDCSDNLCTFLHAKSQELNI